MPVIKAEKDLFETGADALVNPVNCVGVMGAGLAAQMRERYPAMYRRYREHCQLGRFRPGQAWIWAGSPAIICVATKDDYRQSSRYDWIEAGAERLRRIADSGRYRTIAVPHLGCGYGGLDWERVEAILKRHLAEATCDMLLVRRVMTPAGRSANSGES